jgi:hypothetical protein
MPWARIPPDKLINLPLFGIDVIHEEEDFVWMTGGPEGGRQRIRKVAPRIWFDDLSDAQQAGATAIMTTQAPSTDIDGDTGSNLDTE